MEEHYERYMDQEEEYERESISDSNCVYSDSDSDHVFVGGTPETYGSCLCVCMSFHPFAEDLVYSYNVNSKVQ